jgi:hypothetical protein
MRRARIVFVLGFLLLGAPSLQGCASEQNETVRETTMSTDAGPPPSSTSTTTTTEKATSHEPDSVVGATAHAIGTAVLFPFRLAGDTLELIF